MNDLMFKATTEEDWDAFVATFPQTEIFIDEIGPIVITPAVYNPDGTVLTPAVMDNAYHANVRVIYPYITAVDEEGDVVEIDVCATLAAGGTGVTWIDPADVETPARTWAGGMNYWLPSTP